VAERASRSAESSEGGGEEGGCRGGRGCNEVCVCVCKLAGRENKGRTIEQCKAHGVCCCHQPMEMMWLQTIIKEVNDELLLLLLPLGRVLFTIICLKQTLILGNCVAAVLYLQFLGHVMLFRVVIIFSTCTLVTAGIVQSV